MSRVFDAAQTGANETNLVTPANVVYNSLPAWTYAAWVYPTASDGFGVILVKDATGTYSTFFNLASLTLDATANLQGGLTASSASNESLSLNTWSHIAATYDSTVGTVRLYINGVESTYSSQTSQTGTPVDDSAAGYWFGNDTFDDGFTGRIAEIAIWNEALTSGQVATVAASTTGVSTIQPTHLVGYWHLLGTSSPEPDSTTNGDNAVLSSNPPLPGPNSPGFSPVSYYSQPDCRNFGRFPNSSRAVNGTLIYDVQTSSNSAVPGTDSRAAGAPVASGTYPQNSRTPGVFGPNE